VAAAGGGGDSAHAEELLSALARRVTLLLRAVQAPSAPGHGGPT
jgi:hypothetical protein